MEAQSADFEHLTLTGAMDRVPEDQVVLHAIGDQPMSISAKAVKPVDENVSRTDGLNLDRINNI
jgi:hypothetical protein